MAKTLKEPLGAREPWNGQPCPIVSCTGVYLLQRSTLLPELYAFAIIKLL